MKKKSVYILVLFFFLSLFNSCKNPENEPENNLIPENYIKITGKWGFEELDFLEGVEAWPDTLEFTLDNGGFGWAPVMFSGIKTFNFRTKEHSDKGIKGRFFSFATTTGHASGTKIHWVWNFKDQGKSFEIKQINKAMPPFDFSLSKAENIVMTKEKISFVTTINSRVPGGTMTDYIVSKVKITLTKKKEELTPQLFIKGKTYTLPK